VETRGQALHGEDNQAVHAPARRLRPHGMTHRL
jgi:hypothetical protein